MGVKGGQPAGLQGSQGPRCKAARQGVSDDSATDEVLGAREHFLLCGLWSDDATGFLMTLPGASGNLALVPVGTGRHCQHPEASS